MCFTTVILSIFCAASLGSAASLLVLPLGGNADKGDAMVINHLYRDALQAQFNGTVLFVDSMKSCEDRNCALSAAREVKADQVIYSSLYRIGSKGIFSSSILSTYISEAFNQRLTALSIEDMEAITKRMADALLNRKNIEQAATVDNVTEKEETRAPERRRSLYAGGVRVGYLFPTPPSSSFSYQREHHSCDYCYDGDTITYSKQTFSQIIHLSLFGSWQFNNNLLLNTDIVWGIALPFADFGIDGNLDYIFTRGDYSPFVGGGLGIHWVHPDDGTDIGGSKNNSGFTITPQVGMLLFRTYDVNVMVRVYYQVIFDTDMDKGVGLDIGFTFRGLGF